ncbi:MAG TPA: type I pullulanase [Bacteroidales bacterium]|nr:type I pullulanase [Bacteroidales bacterium]
MKRLPFLFVIIIVIMNSCNEPADKKSTDFDSLEAYSGDDLGVIYTPEATTFKVWAPTAEAVRVNIYEKGSGGDLLEKINLQPGISGIWAVTAEKDLIGKFYTFQVELQGQWLDETPGIYAVAVGINGKRGAIINFEATNPEGWDNDQKPPLGNYNDIILYELHVRDMTIHPSSGAKDRGKFTGLSQTGTTSAEGLKTGIDHIKELGVTHVHILPAFDYRSIDETNSEKAYNWGYDPENYNVPEGTYATDAADPATRIREFKQLVKTIHDAGLRVVMDVVYNQTGKTENSNFNLMVPGYYYRQNADGTFSNASGCGNETASERPMMRNFMISSVKHWVEEYHVDGFRFDLMGIHDIETMNAVSEAIHAIDPTIFLYGEGWTAGACPLPDDQLALKKNVALLDSIAVFSDDIRDGIKGSWNDHESKGWVSGNSDLQQDVRFGIVASVPHPQVDYSKVSYSDTAWAREPWQTINYVSVHDNHTLLDKLYISNPNDSETTLIRRHKLANTIVLTSQGIPLLHAGVEILRTKQGVENSYNAPDSINQIDWSRKAKFHDVFDYYRDLITLRREHPAFRMTTTEEIYQNLEFIEQKDLPGVIVFVLKNNANGDSWKNIAVIYNTYNEEKIVQIPFGKWTFFFDENGLHPKGLRTIKHDKITVPPISAMVLGEEG